MVSAATTKPKRTRLGDLGGAITFATCLAIAIRLVKRWRRKVKALARLQRMLPMKGPRPLNRGIVR